MAMQQNYLSVILSVYLSITHTHTNAYKIAHANLCIRDLGTCQVYVCICWVCNDSLCPLGSSGRRRQMCVVKVNRVEADTLIHKASFREDSSGAQHHKAATRERSASKELADTEPSRPSAGQPHAPTGSKPSRTDTHTDTHAHSSVPVSPALITDASAATPACVTVTNRSGWSSQEGKGNGATSCDRKTQGSKLTERTHTHRHTPPAESTLTSHHSSRAEGVLNSRGQALYGEASSAPSSTDLCRKAGKPPPCAAPQAPEVSAERPAVLPMPSSSSSLARVPSTGCVSEMPLLTPEPVEMEQEEEPPALTQEMPALMPALCSEAGAAPPVAGRHAHAPALYRESSTTIHSDTTPPELTIEALSQEPLLSAEPAAGDSHTDCTRTHAWTHAPGPEPHTRGLSTAEARDTPPTLEMQHAQSTDAVHNHALLRPQPSSTDKSALSASSSSSSSSALTLQTHTRARAPTQPSTGLPNAHPHTHGSVSHISTWSANATHPYTTEHTDTAPHTSAPLQHSLAFFKPQSSTTGLSPRMHSLPTEHRAHLSITPHADQSHSPGPVSADPQPQPQRNIPLYTTAAGAVQDTTRSTTHYASPSSYTNTHDQQQSHTHPDGSVSAHSSGRLTQAVGVAAATNHGQCSTYTLLETLPPESSLVDVQSQSLPTEAVWASLPAPSPAVLIESVRPELTDSLTAYHAPASEYDRHALHTFSLWEEEDEEEDEEEPVRCKAVRSPEPPEPPEREQTWTQLEPSRPHTTALHAHEHEHEHAQQDVRQPDDTDAEFPSNELASSECGGSERGGERGGGGGASSSDDSYNSNLSESECGDTGLEPGEVPPVSFIKKSLLTKSTTNKVVDQLV